MMYGFWSCVDGTPPSEVARSRAALIDSLARSLADKLARATQAGDGYLGALRREHQARERGSITRAPAYAGQVRACGADYASRILEVADLGREVACYASALWIPSRDVAHSGLAQRDLDTVCDVTGSSLFGAGGLL